MTFTRSGVLRLDPDNRGFSRVARGDQPISGRWGINKDGVEWMREHEVDLFMIVIPNADFYRRTPTRRYTSSNTSIIMSIVRIDNAQPALHTGCPTLVSILKFARHLCIITSEMVVKLKKRRVEKYCGRMSKTWISSSWACPRYPRVYYTSE